MNDSAVFLVCIAGPDHGKRLAIREGETLLGRSTQCHVVLSDDQGVAERHINFILSCVRLARIYNLLMTRRFSSTAIEYSKAPSNTINKCALAGASGNLPGIYPTAGFPDGSITSGDKSILSQAWNACKDSIFGKCFQK
jgi:hypothetical protein